MQTCLTNKNQMVIHKCAMFYFLFWGDDGEVWIKYKDQDLCETCHIYLKIKVELQKVNF